MNIAFIQIFHNPGKSLIPTLKKNMDLLLEKDHFYIVLDGCTDASESLVENYISEFNHRVTVISTNDIHEILALNYALDRVRASNPGAIVHLQGDMIIEARNFSKVRHFLASKTNFGICSLRMGGCPSAVTLDFNFSEGVYGHKGGIKYLSSRISAAEVCVVVRGPLILSRYFLDVIDWQIDPNLAPHSYDDIDLSLASRRNGFANYFIESPYRSDVTWGTTRKENRSFTESVDVSYTKNKRYVFEKNSLNKHWISCPGHPALQTIRGFSPQIYYWKGMLFNFLLTYPESNNPLMRNIFRGFRKISFLLSNRDFES